MKKTDPLLIVEETFDTSLKNLWEAITDPNQMNKWLFDQIEAFKPEVGFETEFLIDLGDRQFTHLWKVTEVKLNHLIKYQWRYKEYDGDSYVTFQLNEENETAKLTLTAEIIEDFPDNIPEFKREAALAGWNYLIKESLQKFLKAQ